MSLFDRLVVAGLPVVPKSLVRRVAAPYVAGEALDDFVRVARGLNAEGFRAAGGILGEFVESREAAEAAASDYVRTLDAIDTHGLDSNIHVKLTHFGLKIDPALCLRNVRRVVEAASAHGNFVRIDMEDSSCTDETIDIYLRLRDELDNVGIVIQACLRRSLADVRRLAEVRANVRLCKGIYIEPIAIAYHDPEIVRRNFVWLLEELLGAGSYVGIATHDARLVWESVRIVDRLGLGRTQYEFQMLLGVLPGLRAIIRDAGHVLRVAVPFGPDWYPYSIRRLRKNPAIAGHVLRAMFGR